MMDTLELEKDKKGEDNIVKDMKKFFRLRKIIDNSASKEEIKDKVIRDIETLFEEEDDYYKPIKEGIFGTAIISNTKVMVTKIKIYQ